MSLRNINKFIAFVILLAASAVLLQCAGVFSREERRPGIDNASSDFEGPETIAQLRSTEINESSGLVVSRCQSDVFWTHNDSGDGPFIYAFNAAGEHLGTWRVTDSKNVDWEDIATMRNAAGECFLYIGEIGNNERKRTVASVYKVKEPIVSSVSNKSSRKQPLETERAAVARFSYPSPQDAEALAVHPHDERIYVITKYFSGPANVYRVEPWFGSEAVQKVESVGKIALPAVPQGLITGADISPDGWRIVVCDYYAAYEMSLVSAVTNFDEIWKQAMRPIDIGQRAIGESIAYSTDGNAIFATSERTSSPLIWARRKQQ